MDTSLHSNYKGMKVLSNDKKLSQITISGYYDVNDGDHITNGSEVWVIKKIWVSKKHACFKITSLNSKFPDINEIVWISKNDEVIYNENIPISIKFSFMVGTKVYSYVESYANIEIGDYLKHQNVIVEIKNVHKTNNVGCIIETLFIPSAEVHKVLYKNLVPKNSVESEPEVQIVSVKSSKIVKHEEPELIIPEITVPEPELKPKEKQKVKTLKLKT